MNDLFDGMTVPHAFAGKQRTSKVAAAEILPVTGEKRLAVFHFTEDRGAWGATLEEMEIGTGLAANTVRPRRKELEEMGHIVDSGRTRKNGNGRDVIVWITSGNCAKGELRNF